MARYHVTLKDRTVEIVDGADAYQQEGPLTTFFATRENRPVVDAWSERVASVRTSEIAVIRRGPEPAAVALAPDVTTHPSDAAGAPRRLRSA